MNKLQSLRDHVAAHFLWVQQNPQSLSAFVVNGTCNMTLSNVHGIAYDYTARLVLIDFAGDLRELTAAIGEWIKRHQPDIAQNPARRNLFRFEVELLSNKAADVQIDIPMSEAATFVARDGGGFVVTDVQEQGEDEPYNTGPWGVVVEFGQSAEHSD